MSSPTPAVLAITAMSWTTVILLSILAIGVESRPSPDDPNKDEKINLVTFGQADLIGGERAELGSLLSSMFESIMRARIETLLEGSSSHLPEREEHWQIRDIREGEESVKIVQVPETVTEIPAELFTSLPGRVDVLPMGQMGGF